MILLTNSAYASMFLALSSAYSGKTNQDLRIRKTTGTLLELIDTAKQFRQFSEGAGTIGIMHGDLGKAMSLLGTYTEDKTPSSETLGRMHEGLSALAIGEEIDEGLKVETLRFLEQRANAYRTLSTIYQGHSPESTAI